LEQIEIVDEEKQLLDLEEREVVVVLRR